MPEVQLTGWQACYFMLIIIALPLQYYLVEWTGNSSELIRSNNIESIIKSSHKFFNSYFTLDSWKFWAKRIFLLKLKTKKEKYDERRESLKPRERECVAKEIFLHREPDGNFGGSSIPRNPRPPTVKYRVGQVIKHKRYGYRGVIIGWDQTCKAPTHWIEQNHKGHLEYKNQPSYSVLVHVKDRPGGQTTYVAQDNIEIITNSDVTHPQVDDYFDFFDGAQYHMRPAIKAIYPLD